MYDAAHLVQLEDLVRRSLACWSLGPRTEVRLLNVSENATFALADPETGRHLALRLQRPHYHTRAEIESEIAWIEALRAQAVVRTPAPVQGRDSAPIQTIGDGAAVRHAVAFAFVPGREPGLEDDLVPWFRELGEITARLHQHVRSWTPPAAFTRKIWDFHAALGKAPLWGDWRAGLGLDDEGRAVLQRAVDRIEILLGGYGQTADRFGIVHADLRLANLLVEGELLNVIDFDDCGRSWLAYDFAAAVSFFEHEPIVPELMAVWLEGYRRVAAPPPEAEAMLPVMVMLRRILLVAWIASHAETPTAQATGPSYTETTVAMAERFLSTAG